MLIREDVRGIFKLGLMEMYLVKYFEGVDEGMQIFDGFGKRVVIEWSDVIWLVESLYCDQI